jgi:Flp pilus assembly protein TadB
MAEILSRAEQKQQRLDAEREAKAEGERRLAAQEVASVREQSEKALANSARAATIAQEKAVKLAVEQARQEMMASLNEERRRTANRRAGYILTTLRLLLLAALVFVLADTVRIQIQEGTFSRTMIVLTVILAVVNVGAFADLLKFPFMEASFTKFRGSIARLLGAETE